jgi:hypothetical protein
VSALLFAALTLLCSLPQPDCKAIPIDGDRWAIVNVDQVVL